MDKALLEAFNRTKYFVDSLNTFMLVGHQNYVIDDWLTKMNQEKAFFITAYNPMSRQLPDKENEKRNNRLVRELKKYTYLHGRGKDPKHTWPAEESYLVTKVHEEVIKKLMQDFEQLAYIRYLRGRSADLILLNPSS